jgi:LemA protein
MDAIVGLFMFLFWVAVFVGIYAIFQFNKLRQLKETVNRRRANVGAAIKKRGDIMNRVAEAVKGYQGFEQLTTLKMSQDNTAVALAAAYSQTNGMMAAIQSAAQRFPDFRTSALYQEFTQDNRNCNTDIETRTLELTASIDDYNSKRGGLPVVLIAGFLGFRREEYPKFDTAGAETEVESMKDLNAIGTRDDERIEQLLGSAGSSLLGATKVLAGHANQAGKALAAGAGQASRMLAEKIKEKTAGTKYFYAPPGGVPQGPASFDEIQALRAQGSIPENVMLAEVGSQSWQPYSAVAAALGPPAAVPAPPPPSGPPGPAPLV